MTTQELVFLDPKTIKDSQVDEVTQIVSKAFQDFNTSVNAPVEVYEEEFGHPAIGPTVIQSICKSYEGYAAVEDGGAGKIVGVSFVDVHAKGSRVATLGPVASLASGAGKKSFVAACAYAEELGFSTLILTQIAANSRSFSLYAKLGFETKHTVQYIGGFLEPPSEGSLPLPPAPNGVSLKAMVAGDVEECAELFLEAHGKDCGWDRRADITGCLGSGFPFPMLVARDADGKVVGYSTGFFMIGHTVAKSQDIFCYMFREGSKLHQQAGLPCPRFYCPVEFTGLLSWCLAQKGLKVFRASLIMARGHYKHTPWPNATGHIVAPSTTGY
ncbi:unnamed protein product [Ectocarpus sp. 12 AP-2014]